MYVEIKVLVTLFINHVFDFWAKRRAVFLIRETDWMRLSMFRGLTLSWFNLYMQVELEANVAPTRVQKVWSVCVTMDQFLFFFWVNKPNLNSCSVPELLSKSNSSPFKNSDFIRWIYRSLSLFPVCTVSLWTIMPWYLPWDLHVPDLKICAWENLSAWLRLVAASLYALLLDEIWDPRIHYRDWLLASRPFILNFSPKLNFSLY